MAEAPGLRGFDLLYADGKLFVHLIDQWPGNERWFDNRCAPMTSEFTVHQNNCYAAAAFGWLCAPR